MRNSPREPRQIATEAEQILWSFLRDRKFHNLKFRRLHRSEKFILDFYCAEKKLCIELDGGV